MKISNLLYFFLLLVIVLIPFQIDKVFFTETSFFAQYLSFYNSYKIDIKDILIVLIGLLWLFKLVFWSKFHVKPENQANISHFLVPALIFISVVISSIAKNGSFLNNYLPSVTILVFLLVLYSFISNNITVKQKFHTIFWLILAISLIQIVISYSQYFTQGSLGIKFLGEEYLKPYLPGVARFRMESGERWIFDSIFNVSRESFVMRTYGTFPHPNVLSSFLIFSSFAASYIYMIVVKKWQKYLIGGLLPFLVFSLGLTFSRASIFIGFLGLCVWFLFLFFYNTQDKNGGELVSSKRKNFISLLVVVLVSGLLTSSLLYKQFLERVGVVSYGTTNKESIDDRFLYQKIALKMIESYPVRGVGYKNFVNRMDEFSSIPLQAHQHQPVHNVYLLIAAETGIFGLFFFLLIFLVPIWHYFRKNFSKEKDLLSFTLLICLVVFLTTGLFDHYLITLTQGRILLFLVLGLFVASFTRNKNEEQLTSK